MSNVLLELSATEIKAYYYLHFIIMNEQILPEYNSLGVDSLLPVSKNVNTIRAQYRKNENMKENCCKRDSTRLAFHFCKLFPSWAKVK